MIAARVFRLLALPGIVIHELAHYCFCCLVGARVHQVVYFSFGTPAGYVVHSVPRKLREHFAIVAGPFLVNSSLAFLLFLAGVPDLSEMIETRTLPDSDVVARVVAMLCLGLSIALQALPSSTDAASLWDVTGRHVRRGNALALFGFPLAATLALANALRTVWVDWLYAFWLFWLAFQLA